jgi:hypothetical protein
VQEAHVSKEAEDAESGERGPEAAAREGERERGLA